MHDFAKQLLNWYDLSGRHDLPWQQDKMPYSVWISEIMLQQTQVNTVIPYYEKFMHYYPDLSSLAEAEEDQVLYLWTGLGYYRRARNIHKTAKIIQDRHQGVLPASLDELVALPGIGRSTAGAILAICHGQRVAILDGNVKRVLCRYFAIHGWPGERTIENTLWERATRILPLSRIPEYTQAIMDLGATVCTRRHAACEHCPVARKCIARKKGLVDRLPESKARKKLPQQSTQFAMIEDEHGALLLEKRPAVGVWGGLWGFPECPQDTHINEWVEDRYGYRVLSSTERPSFLHTFSHFRLEIKPVWLKCQRTHDRINDPVGQYWYLPGDISSQLGMAAPVRRLINELNQGVK